MEQLYYKITFALLWIVYVSIRNPYQKKYKSIEKKTTLFSKREKGFVFLQFVGMGILPWLWILSTWLEPFSMNLPNYIRFFGVILAVISLYYFWVIHKTLNKNWSPILEIIKDHKLIKTGPYKRIRHPMYTQIWGWALAQLIITSNWIVGIFGIIFWAILYFIRVPQEEKMMLEEFGSEYQNYMEETGRILPKM